MTLRSARHTLILRRHVDLLVSTEAPVTFFRVIPAATRSRCTVTAMNGRTRAPRPPSEHFWLGLTRRWREFGGRSRRYEFGSFVLLGSLAMSLLTAVVLGLAAASGTIGLLGLVLATPIVGWVGVSSVAVAVRRLHDIERSGWWALTVAVPPLGVALVAVLLVTDGAVEDNRYGASPKYF